jgi:cytochrome c peroxidase
MKTPGDARKSVGLAALCLSGLLVALPAAADTTIPRVLNPPPDADLSNLPGDLRAVPVPAPANLDDFVRDPAMAACLGKAPLLGHAGRKRRRPGLRELPFPRRRRPALEEPGEPGPEALAGRRSPLHDRDRAEPSADGGDFPLTRLATPGLRGALDPSTDSNDAVASQGIHHPADLVDPLGFQVGGVNTRRVEPRNTPTVINAVFNHRQFWDGRAEEVFNGVNHLGERDPGARVFRADNPSLPVEVRVELRNSSLASQAVAPIVSDIEMSRPGRTAQDVGRELAEGQRKQGQKLAGVRPLAKQLVAPTDSLLGISSRSPQKGLAFNRYDQMIKTAFQERWWRSNKVIRVNADGTKTLVAKNQGECGTSNCSANEYSLLQYNFGLFFGLAVQMYEATLVSDDTPWDRFRREHPAKEDPALNPWVNIDPDHISRLALFGANLFNDRTRGATNVRCSNCHEQAELTDASASRVARFGSVRNATATSSTADSTTSVSARPETIWAWAPGMRSAFLSFTRRMFPGAVPADFGGPVTKGFGTEGAFKIPSLRNVALTAPYFHNGEARTLHEAVELYSRGGNVNPITATDGTSIEPLGVPSLTSDEVDAIVAFLESLTDERVLYRRAPFDHPQLFVPNGHPGNSSQVTDANGDGLADDAMIMIPAVGAAGGAPLAGFLQGEFGP